MRSRWNPARTKWPETWQSWFPVTSSASPGAAGHGPRARAPTAPRPRHDQDFSLRYAHPHGPRTRTGCFSDPHRRGHAGGRVSELVCRPSSRGDCASVGRSPAGPRHVGLEPRRRGVQSASRVCGRPSTDVWPDRCARFPQPRRLRRSRRGFAVLFRCRRDADRCGDQRRMHGPGSGSPFGGQCRFLAPRATVASRAIRSTTLRAGLDRRCRRSVASPHVPGRGR